jgi:hypothetical protein
VVARCHRSAQTFSINKASRKRNKLRPAGLARGQGTRDRCLYTHPPALDAEQAEPLASPPHRSATNYLLGLTPVQLPAFVLGTFAGMSVWSVLYASLGGASRALLEGGADLELLLTGGATGRTGGGCDSEEPCLWTRGRGTASAVPRLVAWWCAAGSRRARTLHLLPHRHLAPCHASIPNYGI